jgi:Cu-processing system permease protein
VNALLIARFTLQEAISRRLILAALILSAAFLGLYALGFWFVYGMETESINNPGNRSAPILAATVLTVLGLYAVNFLASFLALFLSVGAVSSEVDTGTLLAVMARPLRRADFVLGRWLAYVLMIGLYVTGMVGSVLLLALALADYAPADAGRAIGMMVLSALLLTTLSLFGSTWLPTIANGVVCFSLFGLAWLGGVIELVGAALGNPAMVQLGIAVSLLIPSDALWRGASYYLQPPIITSLIPSNGQWIPIVSNAPPAGPFVAWSAAYVVVALIGAVRVFGRRDL